jgi:hypothetical protein
VKLPPLSAERALGPPVETYRSIGTMRGRSTSIRPQASLSCLTAVVGDEDLANACSLQCGSNLACWQKCAGISSTAPLAACFRD